jgi:hypothetical protein
MVFGFFIYLTGILDSSGSFPNHWIDRTVGSFRLLKGKYRSPRIETNCQKDNNSIPVVSLSLGGHRVGSIAHATPMRYHCERSLIRAAKPYKSLEFNATAMRPERDLNVAGTRFKSYRRNSSGTFVRYTESGTCVKSQVPFSLRFADRVGSMELTLVSYRWSHTTQHPRGVLWPGLKPKGMFSASGSATAAPSTYWHCAHVI